MHNNTRTKMTKLLVSEDKKEWGYFDIGSGIAAGGNMTLVWDSSSNNEGCNQYVKAAYADGSESEEAKFNFCEADLELDFLTKFAVLGDVNQSPKLYAPVRAISANKSLPKLSAMLCGILAINKAVSLGSSPWG
ncbi:MAG: hypothetical protein Q8L15_04235 [Methylobacter sp.]|nr:hypothetical protein [Methylobacter sp.]